MQQKQKKLAGYAMLAIGAVLLIVLLKKMLSPTSPSGRSYSVSAGNDLAPGSDIFQLNNTTAASCEAQCDTTAGCAGFAFNGQTCWGKASSSPLVPASGVDAYIAA